eukprot:4923613-Heterocapsa_arctica.AAC.1
MSEAEPDRHLGPPGDVKPDLKVPDQRAALRRRWSTDQWWTECDGQSGVRRGCDDDGQDEMKKM